MNRLKNISIIFLLSSFLLSFVISCDSTDPKPVEKPPGYQEDIPWPSLADSPWPMNQHDPQSTGRTSIVGPNSPNIEWKYSTEGTNTGVSIDPFGNILTASAVPQGLISLTKSGEKNWLFSLDTVIKEFHTTPIITSENQIIVSTGSKGDVISLDLSGNLKWSYRATGSVYLKGMNLDKVGNIYFIDNVGTLYSLNNGGELLWSLSNSDFNWSSNISITFSPDGNLLFIPGFTKTVYCVSIESKDILWGFGTSRFDQPAVINSQGDIFVHSLNSDQKYELYCLNNNGEIKWSYPHLNRSIVDVGSDISIDKNGNIYFCSDTLYSVNYKGELNWKIQTPGLNGAPLVIDGNNDIFVSTEKDFHGYLLKMNSEGEILWTYEFPYLNYSGTSPAIDGEGRLIVTTYYRDFLYSFK